MRSLVLLIFGSILFITSCSKYPDFEEIPCDENQYVKNTRRRVFRTCRTFIYKVRVWDIESNLISDEMVSLQSTGKPLDINPKRDLEAIVQYDFSKTDQNAFDNSIKWEKKTTSVVVDNSKEIWFNPFQNNQYGITALAPKPQVKFPLEIGKYWESEINTGDNLGELSDITIKQDYLIEAFEHLEDLQFFEKEAWHISSKSETSQGIIENDFWFNENLGFVKIIYNNYDGQTIKFELISIKE